MVQQVGYGEIVALDDWYIQSSHKKRERKSDIHNLKSARRVQEWRLKSGKSTLESGKRVQEWEWRLSKINLHSHSFVHFNLDLPISVNGGILLNKSGAERY